MKKTRYSKKKLNIGCGLDIKPDHVNLDIAQNPGVDVAHDLDVFPWPFEDNAFEEVYARDVIEHMKDIFKAMKEIKRICKQGAKVRIIVPYWHSSEAFYLDHVYFFNVDSLKYFTEPNRNYMNHYCFKIQRIDLIPSSIGWLIPPLPVPRSLFPNVLNLRHLFSYLLGQIIVKIDFKLIVVK